MLDLECGQELFTFYRTYDKYCSSWVATAIVGSAAVGGLTSLYTSSQASKAQQSAAQQAAQTEQRGQDIAQGMYDKTRGDLSPYRDIGTKAYADVNNLPFVTNPDKFSYDEKFAPPTDQASLEETPGYQFTKTQGLKAVANSAAARGLGTSGAALKGAATFATGLADNTYQQNYDRALTTYNTKFTTAQNTFNTNQGAQSNAFNRLSSLIGVGAGAAGATGTAGTAAGGQSVAAAGQIGGSQIAGGNAAAAGSNAIGSNVTNFANNVAGYGLYKGIYGKNTNGSNGSPVGPVGAGGWQNPDYATG